MLRGRGIKRRAEVPRDAGELADEVSKADLLEAAWHLASLCNDSGCDDDGATLSRLHEELNALRANRGGRLLPPLGQMRAKWSERRERRRG